MDSLRKLTFVRQCQRRQLSAVAESKQVMVTRQLQWSAQPHAILCVIDRSSITDEIGRKRNGQNQIHPWVKFFILTLVVHTNSKHAGKTTVFDVIYSVSGQQPWPLWMYGEAIFKRSSLNQFNVSKHYHVCLSNHTMLIWLEAKECDGGTFAAHTQRPYTSSCK